MSIRESKTPSAPAGWICPACTRFNGNWARTCQTCLSTHTVEIKTVEVDENQTVRILAEGLDYTFADLNVGAKNIKFEAKGDGDLHIMFLEKRFEDAGPKLVFVLDGWNNSHSAIRDQKKAYRKANWVKTPNPNNQPLIVADEWRPFWISFNDNSSYSMGKGSVIGENILVQSSTRNSTNPRVYHPRVVGFATHNNHHSPFGFDTNAVLIRFRKK